MGGDTGEHEGTAREGWRGRSPLPPSHSRIRRNAPPLPAGSPASPGACDSVEGLSCVCPLCGQGGGGRVGSGVAGGGVLVPPPPPPPHPSPPPLPLLRVRGLSPPFCCSHHLPCAWRPRPARLTSHAICITQGVAWVCGPWAGRPWSPATAPRTVPCASRATSPLNAPRSLTTALTTSTALPPSHAHPRRLPVRGHPREPAQAHRAPLPGPPGT